jgi:xanthine dehydrogenase accessory factor
MFAIADALVNGFERNEPLAVATVIDVVGSAPRALGTSMAVDVQGKVTGSLSGGCLEGAVYEACLEVLSTGKTHVEDFGLVDDDPFAIGLSCGGRIRVCIQKFHNDRQGVAVAQQLRLARRGKPAGLAMVIAPATQSGRTPFGEPLGIRESMRVNAAGSVLIRGPVRQ